MKSVRRLSNHAFLAAAVFAVTLRVVVPVGLMPADVQQGWFLQWCPDGMSAQTMSIVMGHTDGHAGHGPNSDAELDLAPCELGGYSADSAVSEPSNAGLNSSRTPDGVLGLLVEVFCPPTIVFQQRAPPRVYSFYSIV